MTSRQEWLLLALAHRRGQPMTPAQIQKSMFLMRMEAGRYLGDRFYEFIPYNYGPFDADIYRDLDWLAAKGVVITDTSPGRNWRTYAVTPAGIDAAERAMASADRTAVSYLGRVVDWVTSVSFPVLIRAIYDKYPQFKANSVFAG
jgi:DNA-binding PadR family transcriptional regulator